MINKSGSKTLIIFDIDGTLTDSVAVHQAAFTDSLNELGINKIDSSYGDYKHHTDSYIAKVIYENFFDSEFTTEIQNDFENAIFSKLKEISVNEINGAKSVLKKITSSIEIDYCFATGSFEKPAKYKLDCLDFIYDNSLLVCSNKLHSRDDIVKIAIQRAKEYYKQDSYERIISVGDGLWDLKTAKNLGLEFIGIGNRNKNILFENGCTKYFNDLKEIELSEL